MKNPWFRLYSETVDDEKLRLLAFEDRWHYIALLCCKNSGVLDDPSPLMRRKVAVKLGLDLRELDEVVRRLSEVSLIDKDTFQPLGWEKRQYRSDKDPTAAKRQKKFRESRKSNALRNGDSNANVTPLEQNTEEVDSDTEAEADTDISSVYSTSTPASCCQQMRACGIAQTNPSHPTLIALVEAGATESEFDQAAKVAIGKGKADFAYVIGIVKRQREEAAKLVLHKGRLPNKQEALEAANRAATADWMPPELRGNGHAN